MNSEQYKYAAQGLCLFVLFTVTMFTVHCGVAAYLVRMEELESPTYWFVASHSIRLSYMRMVWVSITL